MSLEGVRWTWACREPGCGWTGQTAAKEGPPACPRHGIDPMERACEICSISLVGRRADAETCTGPCRAEKSRRRKDPASAPQAHTGAQAKARPRQRKRRRKERGVRVYLLPDELADAARRYAVERAGGGLKRGTAAERAAGKFNAARRRLSERS